MINCPVCKMPPKDYGVHACMNAKCIMFGIYRPSLTDWNKLAQTIGALHDSARAMVDVLQSQMMGPRTRPLFENLQSAVEQFEHINDPKEDLTTIMVH